MESSKYAAESNRTRPFPQPFIINEMRLMQSILGLNSEAGEVAGFFEKMWVQGHPFDENKLRKELGDVMWYFFEILAVYGWTLEEILEQNIQKLKTRFPEKFTTEGSITRVDEEPVVPDEDFGETWFSERLVFDRPLPFRREITPLTEQPADIPVGKAFLVTFPNDAPNTNPYADQGRPCDHPGCPEAE